MCKQLQLLPGNRWQLQYHSLQDLHRGKNVLRLLYIEAEHDYGLFLYNFIYHFLYAACCHGNSGCSRVRLGYIPAVKDS